MRKNYSILAMMAAVAVSAGVDLRANLHRGSQKPKDRAQRTPDDISARQRKRQAKRHAGEAKGDCDA